MLVAAVSACTVRPAPVVTHAPYRVPVELVTAGDDGLTQRLASAIRIELASSAAFSMAPAPVSDLLTVIIPTHVGWEEVGGKTRVTFELWLKRGGQKLSEAGGKCWEHELSVCAQSVVEAARRATNR